MAARDQILANIRANQPEDKRPLPDLSGFPVRAHDLLDQYMTVLSSIGGSPVKVANYAEIEAYVKNQGHAGRVVSTIPELQALAEPIPTKLDPHTLEKVDLAIISGAFGVAENSAIWVSELNYQERVAPFICQHLAIVLPITAICANMHQAYTRLQGQDYGFGAFIAGPSKTADIEQS